MNSNNVDFFTDVELKPSLQSMRSLVVQANTLNVEIAGIKSIPSDDRRINQKREEVIVVVNKIIDLLDKYCTFAEKVQEGLREIVISGEGSWSGRHVAGLISLNTLRNWTWACNSGLDPLRVTSDKISPGKVLADLKVDQPSWDDIPYFEDIWNIYKEFYDHIKEERANAARYIFQQLSDLQDSILPQDGPPLRDLHFDASNTGCFWYTEKRCIFIEPHSSWIEPGAKAFVIADFKAQVAAYYLQSFVDSSITVSAEEVERVHREAINSNRKIDSIHLIVDLDGHVSAVVNKPRIHHLNGDLVINY